MVRSYEEAGKDPKRKWQCFCCGKFFNNYDEYKSHIVGTHDQGREYIKCPTCDAPVRDMFAHFRAKHPNRAMPKGVQTRVGIWHDYSISGKKKKTRVQAHKGEFESQKNGQIIKYRSNFERDFYEQLESDLDVMSYAGEPFKVPYFWSGAWHEYTPDIRVDFIDGSVEIWEIKPAAQTGEEYDQNQAKWVAMNNFAKNMGWQFTVQTEVALGKLKNKIRKQRLLYESSSQKDPSTCPSPPLPLD